MSRNIIQLAAYPDRWAGNDPEALGLAIHQGPTCINASCQAPTNLVDRDW